MNTALLDALVNLRCVERHNICEDLGLPGQIISEAHRAHSVRVAVAAEKMGIVRELEAAIEGVR